MLVVGVEEPRTSDLSLIQTMVGFLIPQSKGESMPRDEVCLYSEEELEEVMKMTPKELLESGKWVILYDWQPSLKLYEDS